VSIIQEALKKVGTGQSRETQSPPPPNAAPPETAVKKPVSAAATQKSEPGLKVIYYTIAALLVVILIGIAARISHSPAPVSTRHAVTPKKIEPIMPTIEKREESPAPKKRKRENIGGFVLNGIMYLVDGPRAIINDIIVGEGESVGGAKVQKIKKDQVVLEYDDSEVELSINK
jgi:hypothetical protein